MTKLFGMPFALTKNEQKKFKKSNFETKN